MKIEENKTIGKIVVFIWFVLFPAISFYLFPDACIFAVFITFVVIGISVFMDRFGHQEVRKDSSSYESWGSGWSDSWGSWDYGGGWDGGYGGDCGGGDGGGDCGGGE